jgi:lipoprotein-anchoring transpeptidase ErfK/SrfK
MSGVRKLVWVPAVAVVVVAGGAVAAMNVYDHKQRDRIAPGISIGKVAVGNLTAAQAREKVANELHTQLNQDVTIKAGGHRYTLSGADLDRRVNVEDLVDQAVTMSHKGGIVHRTLNELKGTPIHATLPVTVSYSKAAVRKAAARVGRSLDKDPVNATVTPDASGLKQTPSKNGVKVAQASLRKRLYAKLALPEGVTSVRAHLSTVKPAVSTADLAKKYPSYIIVDRAHFTLRLYRGLKLDSTYPIAVGRQGLETPAGLYDVQWRETNPSWHVPNSAWAGDLAGKTIPPGPDDPIKARWMGFNGGAGIHGIDPSEYSSIGHNASHGCVRMRIPDVIDVYDKTDVGTPVYVA